MAARSSDAASHRVPPERAGKRALIGWMLFDWATQPFYTLVVTFLFAPYFVNGFMDDPAQGSTLWAYATGISELIAAAIAPMLGSIVDAGLPRKPWIAGFSVLLVAGMCGLWLAAPGRVDLLPLVLISFGIATVGAELATVFTNAMMPSLVGDHLGVAFGEGDVDQHAGAASGGMQRLGEELLDRLLVGAGALDRVRRDGKTQRLVARERDAEREGA